MTLQSTPSWYEPLLERASGRSLVKIAQEGRLVRAGEWGPTRVQLTQVDEAVLALVDLALRQEESISIVYPLPAGEVAVLLASEILLHRFVGGDRSPSLGLLTADPSSANRTWNQLEIRAQAQRAPISDVLPCFRCEPDGSSPVGRRGMIGLLVGQRFNEWPVDLVIADHLAGPIYGLPDSPTIRIIADPFDRILEASLDKGHLIWGFSPTEIVTWYGHPEEANEVPKVPFSVSHERIRMLSEGVCVGIRVAEGDEARACVGRVRDDLRTLADAIKPDPSLSMIKGLRVAWHHLTTLMTLPCRPSEFDLFAGIPPIAARATYTFEPEMEAWASSLSGDASEIASVLSSDLGELRAALELENPFFPDIAASAHDDVNTIVVVRTHTAARALVNALGGDQATTQIGSLSVRSLRRLHREGTWERAIVLGAPPRWELHRFDSGLTPDLRILVLGMADAQRSQSGILELQEARRRWSQHEERARVWRRLVDSEIPGFIAEEAKAHVDIEIVAAAEAPEDIDPFAEFEPLLGLSPLLIGDEGLGEFLAEETDGGDWVSEVEAVGVETEAGLVLLPTQRVVEVRKNDSIIDCLAEKLEPGMFLLIGRAARRIGLLDAIAEHLSRNRPDILASSLLARDLRLRIGRAFVLSGLTKSELFDRMREVGFTKSAVTAGRYVEGDGPMAPRDFDDLQRLNDVIDMGLDSVRLREIFTGVRRLRIFRRAAGRSLAAAARGSVAAANALQVDPNTGISVADLRDAVIEAKILRVTKWPGLVPLTEVGELQAET